MLAWQELAEDGVNVFAMRSDVSLDDAGWGSPTFHKMVRLRPSLPRPQRVLTIQHDMRAHS